MESNKFERIIEKMEVQSKLTWKREEQLVRQQGICTKDEFKILEIGSGPGVITKNLCELFPNSKITSLEIEQDFVNYSSENLEKKYKDRVEILCGDITNIELPAETYDIVYARLVLQHVHGVDEAIKNIYKALKKGGKIIITDVDEGLFGIIDPPCPELSYVLGKHIDEQVIEGGDRFIGRKLWRKLKTAQFNSINLDLLPVNSDELGIQAFIPQVDYEEMSTMIDNKLITQEDIDKIKNAADKFLNSEYPFALLVLFFIVGTK